MKTRRDPAFAAGSLLFALFDQYIQRLKAYFRGIPEDFVTAPGGQHFGAPPGAVLPDIRARWHFQNAVWHTFAGKSRPSDTISHIHRARC